MIDRLKWRHWRACVDRLVAPSGGEQTAYRAGRRAAQTIMFQPFSPMFSRLSRSENLNLSMTSN